MNRNVRLVLIMLAFVTLLACLVPFVGRTRPGDHPINSSCTWIEDNRRPLNLAVRADRTDLRDDAVTAEDVAIRWADKYFGHLPDYEPRRDEAGGVVIFVLATLLRPRLTPDDAGVKLDDPLRITVSD